MRMGEENIVVPLDSPERPPATNYAVVLYSSPTCLSITRAPLSAAAAEAGASLGCAVSGPRQRLRVLCGPSCPSGRPSSSSLGFQIVLFYSFHRLVYRFKNMYLLVGRFK